MTRALAITAVQTAAIPVRPTAVIVGVAIAYFAVCTAIVIWAARRTRTREDFFVAGPGVGLWTMTMAAMSATLSGFIFIGGPGLLYSIGLGALFISLSASITTPMSAWLLARPMRVLRDTRGAITVPDAVGLRYESRGAQGICAIAILVATVGYIATNLLALGLVLQAIFALPLTEGVWIGSAVVVAYSATGGILAGVYTDVFQGSIKAVASVLVFAAILRAGHGLGGITRTLLAHDAAFVGPWGHATPLAALSLFLLFGIGTLGQPHVISKYYMLRDPAQLRWYPLLMTLVLLMTLLLFFGIGVGVKAAVFTGAMAPLASPDDATPAFLLHAASPWLAAIVFSGIAAAIMGTVNAFLNVGAAAVTHDLPVAAGRPLRHELAVGRAATLVIAAGRDAAGAAQRCRGRPARNLRLGTLCIDTGPRARRGSQLAGRHAGGGDRVDDDRFARDAWRRIAESLRGRAPAGRRERLRDRRGCITAGVLRGVLGDWPRPRSAAPRLVAFGVPHLRPDTPVQFLKGIGEKRAEAFARLGVATVQDLALHIPHRYIDASALTPLARARVGDDVACVGTVTSTGVLPTRKGLRIFHAVLRDASGVLECAWPGQSFLDRTIKVGQLLLVAGPVRFYHGRQMAPRETIILDEDDAGAAAARMIPVYAATDGLSHKQIRAVIAMHLDAIADIMPDVLPGPLRERFALPSVREALHAVHRPTSPEMAARGRRRLALDELLDLQLTLGRARDIARRGMRGTQFEVKRTHTSALRQHLPWSLTTDQKRAVREIFEDMTRTERMHRLLMGDVGTGKTVVALFAMLLALENGYQAALMAPTELLTEQHHATLTQLLAPLDLVPELLVGRLTAAAKAAVRERLATGATSLVVGTHALVQEQVGFHRLGLVVIDEQHRFGVEQRAALMHKGEAPDVLLLTATPIPRSLALTRFGDLDVSTLRIKPPGRATIRTAVRTPAHRARVFDFVRRTALTGGQAYIVLPVIEESERADLRAAETMAATLRLQWPDVRVGLVHGRLKPRERDAVMQAFRAGELQVLVATTVIEVGIDVPNATVMVIEHPERFGLAQLHQLRGRVGRGAAESHCILLPASTNVPERLRALAQTQDGFVIAELDLEERSHGDLLGARQSGGVEFKLARFPEDTDILAEARAVARSILDADPQLQHRENRPLRDRALARYPRADVLFRVG